MRRWIVCRVSSLSARTVPPRVALCGITLWVSPAWSIVIERTPVVRGSSVRLTIDWKDWTSCPAAITGSTQLCGQAAWPPRPSTVMSQ